MANERTVRMSRLTALLGVGALSLVTGCGGGGTSGPTELPAQEIFSGQGSAMLKIDRSWDFEGLGSFVMLADFTIKTQHGLSDEPTLPNTVFGSDETEFEAVLVGFGTGGGHTTTATGPVKYEVTGLFQPSQGGCQFELVVTETLLLSRVTSVHNTILGELPVPPGGLGDDVVTTFNVVFEEDDLDTFFIAGSQNSSFTLYDIVLPDGTGCTFTG